MARARLPIVPHLPPEEIARRYRTCRTGVEKTHWQVLRLLTRPDPPLSPAEAAAQVGLSAVWARALLKRWNAEGPDGLADRRAAANGGRSKLSADQQVELWAALPRTPPEGGLWTGPKVAAYVRDRWGVAVGKPTGGKCLHGLGFSPQVPRPRHPKAATAEQQRVWERRPRATPGAVATGAPEQVGRAVGRG